MGSVPVKGPKKIGAYPKDPELLNELVRHPRRSTKGNPGEKQPFTTSPFNAGREHLADLLEKAGWPGPFSFEFPVIRIRADLIESFQSVRPQRCDGEVVPRHRKFRQRSRTVRRVEQDNRARDAGKTVGAFDLDPVLDRTRGRFSALAPQPNSAAVSKANATPMSLNSTLTAG